MSIASIGETLENPSVTQIMAAYPTKKIFDDAVKAGKIKPTREVGIVSNIFNRVVQSALSEQAQAQAQTTVLQDNTQPMGLAAAAQMPQQPRGQGLNQVPVPQQMFERQGMASGGIVAFQAGGGARNPRLIGALENVLAQLQARDPALNVNYVRRAVLSAPEGQQQQLMQQLVERVGMEDQFKPAVTSFTEALKTKEVDPKVMSAMQRSQGLTADEMATPSPLTKEASGLAAAAQRDPRQADTGAQYGARPLTGSQIVAQKADAAGNIYRDALFKQNAEGASSTFAPFDEVIPALGQGVPEPIDPFSATQGRTAIRGGQTDTGAVDYSQETPSTAMLKQAAEDQAKKAEEAKPKPTAAKPAAEEGKDKKPKTYDDYLKEVTNRMGTSTVGSKMRDEIEKDRKSRKEAKQEAMWISLVEAGLGIMGGESPYAAVNIGKGATNALKSYADRLREQKKLDREDRRILLDLEKAERAEQRDNYKLASDLYSKSLDRMSAEERTRITAGATRYAAELNADVAKQAYSMMKPQAFLGEERQRLALANEAIKNLPMSNPDYRKMSPIQRKTAEDQIYLQLGIDPATKKFMYGQSGGAGVNTSALGPILDFQTAVGTK